MPVGCITAGPMSVTWAVGDASLCHAQLPIATTSTVVQLYCTPLSGAISSTRALLYFTLFDCLGNSHVADIVEKWVLRSESR